MRRVAASVILCTLVLLAGCSSAPSTTTVCTGGPSVYVSAVVYAGV